jgi:hypothetical protein
MSKEQATVLAAQGHGVEHQQPVAGQREHDHFKNDRGAFVWQAAAGPGLPERMGETVWLAELIPAAPWLVPA